LLLISFQKFDLGSPASSAECFSSITRTGDNEAEVSLSGGHTFKVTAGRHDLGVKDYHYVPTSYHDAILVEMLQSHAYHDLCVIGPKVGEQMIASQWVLTTKFYYY